MVTNLELAPFEAMLAQRVIRGAIRWQQGEVATPMAEVIVPHCE